MDMMERYKKQAESGRSAMNVEPSAGVKRKGSTFHGSVSEEEILELDQRKHIMITECSKPHRERNFRLLDLETIDTFSLRRQFALSSAPHAQTIVKEWPSLRVEFILLKELCLIKPEANNFLEFNFKLESILPKLIEEARRKASSYPRSQPLGKLLEKIPFLEETDPEYDIGINIIGAITGLTYILPTTAKKMSLPHRHLIDICPSNSSAEDVRSAVEDRYTPYIQIFGSVLERQKVVVYADKVAMLMCSSVSKALYATLSAHYILDVEYSVVMV